MVHSKGEFVLVTLQPRNYLYIIILCTYNVSLIVKTVNYYRSFSVNMNAHKMTFDRAEIWPDSRISRGDQSKVKTGLNLYSIGKHY